MESADNDRGLTLKDLVRETGAAPHIVRYLVGLGRLPIIRESLGAGYPHIFHPNAITIVRKHLEKSGSMLVENEENHDPSCNY